MTIWNCKRAGLTIGALLLAGCNGAPMSFMSNLKVPSLGKKALQTETRLSGSRLTLVAPDGYCIDSTNQTAEFALMARCDVLGSEEDVTAPIAIIAVSVTPPPADGTLPSAEVIAKTKGLSEPTRIREEDGQVIFRTTGTPPGEGLDETHWRGAALIGDQIVGVGVFGPEGGRAVSSEGSMVIADLFQRTRAAQ